ncbi:MAG: DUF1552 domain-containing protein [Planctomycetota bacterium]
MSKILSRRTALKGLGAAVALPWLEAMAPIYSWANPGRRPPVRMAFIYMPHGAVMRDWTPGEAGALPEQLPAILQPLSGLKNDFSVLTGLSADKARGGSGAHARSMGAFLTATRPRRTEGSDFRAGVSVDQVAAVSIGDQTRLPSLQLATAQAGTTGNCDLGYACAYMRLSWRDAVTPLPAMSNPRHLFERLFTNNTGGNSVRREMERRSLLDFVRDEAVGLQSTLGANDRRKLDEYFSAIREIEQRIERAARMPAPARPNITVPDLRNNDNEHWEEQVRLLGDLLVLAFQTDSTRICTFALNNEFNDRSYPALGFREGHHHVSHHSGNPEMLRKYSLISAHHVTQFAYVLNKLKEAREGDGSLLDNCIITYGSAIRDGQAHDNGDLPILLAGRAGGVLRPGRHIRFPAETPIANLWLSMLDHVNAGADRFGDSTGRLAGL